MCPLDFGRDYWSESASQITSSNTGQTIPQFAIWCGRDTTHVRSIQSTRQDPYFYFHSAYPPVLKDKDSFRSRIQTLLCVMKAVVAACVSGTEQEKEDFMAFPPPPCPETDEFVVLSSASCPSRTPLSRDHITQPPPKPHFRRSASIHLTRRQTSKSPLRRREKTGPELSTKVNSTGIVNQRKCEPVVGRAWIVAARARRRRRTSSRPTVNMTTPQCFNADTISENTS
eukprot:3916658-Rhodomonas_salina.1